MRNNDDIEGEGRICGMAAIKKASTAIIGGEQYWSEEEQSSA